MRYIVTGGMGFFGSMLMNYLTGKGHEALSIDRLHDPELAKLWPAAQLDIEDSEALQSRIKDFGSVDAIFHIAAVQAHDRKSFSRMHSTNVEGTRNVMECAKRLGIPKVIFTSSNCVYASSFREPVTESTPTNPIELYGQAKLEGEKIISSYHPDVAGVSIRCPTIIGQGRLGLLSILFDFVREGRRLYMVGDGSNRYSFIDADDLSNACLLAATGSASGIYVIGADNTPSMRQLYTDLFEYAGKRPRLVCIPEAPTVFTLRILDKLHLSPLGPYHYRMLAANVVMDASKIKGDLGWSPTRTNSQMLCDAYTFYLDNKAALESSEGGSVHRRPAKAGILNLLRMIS